MRSAWRVKAIDLLNEVSTKGLGRSLGGLALMLLDIGNVIDGNGRDGSRLRVRIHLPRSQPPMYRATVRTSA